MSQDAPQVDEFDVAIVGMAGRFPGASDIWAYWDNIAAGIESIRELSEEELRSTGVSPQMYRDPNYVRRAPVLEDADCFDGRFFGFSPRECVAMDPQQRIFLETCYEALEHAGFNPLQCDFPVGVFAGSAMNTYFLNTGLSAGFNQDYLPLLIGNDKDYLATRVAFKLNLRGPAMTIQTACSSSLVAVHTACQSLMNGECDVAIAGGAAVRVPLLAGHLYEEGSVFSADGHVRTFDKNANGTVFGSGVGAVILKPLQDALEDNDFIHAVIRGSAINNDGASKSEYTAPSLPAQADLIVDALDAAGVSADSISYLEAHGTGTFLGDPIEVAAAARAFRSQTSETNFCAIGSVKTNVGHLDAAAGVASLIKVVLALSERKIPPVVGFSEPNPEINFADSPFYVNDEIKDWEQKHSVRRAGITSLGIGGTNAHLVVEEAPSQTRTSVNTSDVLRMIPVSAKSELSLEQSALRLGSFLDSNDDLNVDAVVQTQFRRLADLPFRRVAVGSTVSQLADGLKAEARRATQGKVLTSPDPVFLFPGQGSQHPGMAKRLYASNAIYRQAFDRCCEILDQVGAGIVRDLILLGSQADPDQVNEALAETANTQPALFVIEYCLAVLWQSLGVQPKAMLGHSIGEYVAATIAGVFTLEDAIKIVVERGRLMQSMQPGWMMVVTLPENELKEILPDSVSISVQNGEDLFAIGGSFDLLETTEEILANKDVPYRKLRTSHAFHSAMMEPMLEEFEQFVSSIDLAPPKIDFVSNVTGDWITSEEARNPAYWAAHVRSTVRFADGIGRIARSDETIAIECGPGQSLKSLIMQNRPQGIATAISSLPRANAETGDDLCFAEAIGAYWCHGGELNWNEISGDSTPDGVTVPLPGYAFERTRHWPEEQAQSVDITTVADEPSAFVPSWSRGQSLKSLPRLLPTDFTWLVLATDSGISSRLTETLRKEEADLFEVHPGSSFNQTSGNRITIRPQEYSDYSKAFRIIAEKAEKPIKIVHCWNTDDEVQKWACWDSIVHLFRAAGEELETEVDLTVFTAGAQRVFGTEKIHTLRGIVESTTNALVAENIGARAAVFDLEGISNPANLLSLAGWSENGAAGLAVRGNFVWQHTYSPYSLDGKPGVRDGGVYVITGGLGGIGRKIASHWVQTYGATVVLLTRSRLPEGDSWQVDSQSPTLSDFQKQVATDFRDSLASGGIIELFHVTALDEGELSRVFKEISGKYGAIHGVVHAAGSTNDGLAINKDISASDSVFEPKIHGTEALIRSLSAYKDHLDFVTLMSSTTALSAKPGLVDYGAANAYLDALAETDASDVPISSINWPGWRDVGMIKGSEDVENVDLVEADQALNFLDLLIGQNRPRAVVTKRTADHIGSTPSIEAADSATELAVDVSAMSLEQKILSIIAAQLGAKDVHLLDDFFDLGGNSLIAARLLSAIKKETGVKVELKSFIDEPTAAALVKLIEQA